MTRTEEKRKICPVCGKEFIQYPGRAGRRSTCSPECQLERIREQRRAASTKYYHDHKPYGK